MVSFLLSLLYLLSISPPNKTVGDISLSIAIDLDLVSLFLAVSSIYPKILVKNPTFHLVNSDTFIGLVKARFAVIIEDVIVHLLVLLLFVRS